jgi:glycine/D-amino acid oxidase-like deaminating enzyme/nitrite reductase/ring-hydroxylating ferredoxin subunit
MGLPRGAIGYEREVSEHTSIWIGTSSPADYPPPAGSGAFDVAVIGGGITGLTTALLMRERGARVCVLERHQIATGTTGRTTAKITALHGLTYAELLSHQGEEKARLYAEANQAALAWIADLIARLHIDCQFERAPAYTYTTEATRSQKIEREVEAATRVGLHASYTEETDLPYPVTAAIRLDDQAHFHPRQYCLALAEAIVGAGSAVYEETAATGVVEEGDGVVVHTNRGEIRAERVVVATLLPFLDRGGFFAKATASRSYALAARLRNRAPHGMYLSVDEPTRSVRPYRIDDQNLGVILGGGSHPTGRTPRETTFYEDLEAWGRDAFEIDDISYRWSAQDYISADSIPYVGRSPGTARTFVATGFKKWGITNGTAAAMLLADMLSSIDNPWLKLYDATRIGNASAVKKLVEENAKVATRMVLDRLARLTAPDVAHLQPGDGGVVKVRGRAAGAYRDRTGIVHAVSVTCTHLGCTLQWNDAEATWDCPCHGSRFSHVGRVLEGPATTDLETVPVDPS